MSTNNVTLILREKIYGPIVIKKNVGAKLYNCDTCRVKCAIRANFYLKK